MRRLTSQGPPTLHPCNLTPLKKTQKVESKKGRGFMESLKIVIRACCYKDGGAGVLSDRHTRRRSVLIGRRRLLEVRNPDSLASAGNYLWDLHGYLGGHLVAFGMLCTVCFPFAGGNTCLLWSKIQWLFIFWCLAAMLQYRTWGPLLVIYSAT